MGTSNRNMGGLRVLGVSGPKKAVKAAAPSGKSARYYPADDIARPKHSRKKKKNAPKIRGSFTPGTVLILLAGRFRGKRVVCLKALESGLLLVSGPYQVNGVPLRRVSPTYIIATSTKIDVSKVDVKKYDDAYFGRSAKTSEEEFFAGDDAVKATVSDERKADQQAVDGALVKAVDAVKDLKFYLKAKFSLSKNDKPHNMIF